MISVVLPYRNAATTLREAAKSVLADLGPDGELLLVDDGSTDDGPRVAASLGDGRVVHVATGGVGIARALERGWRASRGDLVARMDADDVSHPGRFAAQAAALEGDPGLGVVASRVTLIGDPGGGVERYVSWQNAILSREDHANAIFVESPVCHPSTMLRRAALEAVGGYRDGPFAEDYDLWLRLDAAGWGIAKLPDVHLSWRMHGANTTWTDPRLSIDAIRRLRAEHLARVLGRPFGIWNAGTAGRRLARELETHDRRAAFFVDIDPRKIGRRRRGAPILDVPTALARTEASGELLVVAVATRGGRELVRGLLHAEGRVERRDFLCAQ